MPGAASPNTPQYQTPAQVNTQRKGDAIEVRGQAGKYNQRPARRSTNRSNRKTERR